MYQIKNLIKTVVFGLTMSALFSGCIKEVTPTDRALETQVTAKSLITGVPAAMMSAGAAGIGEPYDFGYTAMHLAMDSMTGDLVVTGNIGYDWFRQWGSNIALGPEYAAGATFWLNYYSWIKAVNDVIRLIGKKDESLLHADEKTYLGFAYTYRALFYLDLVRLYEFKENNYTEGAHLKGLGVPIVIPETTEKDAKQNPRASVEDVYKLIFNDLNIAEQMLSNYTAEDKYSISLPLVYGLMARAHLEHATSTQNKEEYGEAAWFARKAINTSDCTPLTQEQWEDPINGFNSATSNNAWIWALPLASEKVANLLCFTAHMALENTWSGYAFDVQRGINKNLYHSINRWDFRRHSWLDPDRSSYDYLSCRKDGAKYFSTREDYATIKFRPAQGEYNNYKIGGAADFPCMRVEEMYFIEAEGLAHYSNLADGVKCLNEFMNQYRIIPGGRPYDCTERATTMSGFLNELILQKRIEFWGEGIVLFDMKRLNISTKRGYVGTNAPAAYRLNTEGRAPYWNFAIPRKEVQNNTALVNQNNPDPSQKVPLWQE